MRKLFVWVAGATMLAMTAGNASAQYGPAQPGVSSGVTGDDYHVELSYALWHPSRTILISSESLGILGDRIDVVADLGFDTRTFQDFKVVLRPSHKFKFRFGVTPIKYEGDTILTRSIVFNGQRYTIGLPVTSELEWKSWRFGIEYDFISRSRGFFGVIFEGKYTDLNLQLQAPLIAEFTHVKVPIPTIGAIGRVYVAKECCADRRSDRAEADDPGRHRQVPGSGSERPVQLQRQLWRPGWLSRVVGWTMRWSWIRASWT